MDNNRGGLSDENAKRQKKAAEQIARQQVMNAYERSGAMNSADTGKIKDDPKDIKVTKEEWERYHTAWQDYYQKYYCNYYTQAAKSYIAKEKLKAELKAAEEKEALGAAHDIQHGAENASTDGTGTASFLKKRIQARASDEAIKMKRRKKIAPVIAGVVVVLVFLFLQYNRLIFAPLAAYVSPGESPTDSIEAIDPTVSGTVGPDPKLIIPKINVNVPVAFGINAADVMKYMETGVAHYRISGASAFPGEVGNLVISGHSAGDIYSNLPYKYIFSGLERLVVGDLIYINYNSQRYTYKVTGSQVVEPTNVAALVYDTDKPILTLVTCTPLGTSRYRLLVTAEQISPSTENATQAEPTLPSEELTESMPANEDTFFERIWKWLTRG